MKKTKKLLIITNRYPTGPNDSASPFVYDFRTALQGQGITADVVTPFYESPGIDDRYVDAGVHRFEWSDGRTVISQLPRYHPLTPVKIVRYFANGVKVASQLHELNRYDAVIALWAIPSGHMARRLSERYQVPYAVWTLGSDINGFAGLPVIGRMVQKVLQGADRLFADGHELAEKVRILTHRTCNFLPSFHAIDLKTEGAVTREKRFMAVGRIEKAKGVFDLLEAFDIFRRRYTDWRLYYVGQGRSEKELHRRLAGRGLGEFVTCTGYLPREEVNALLVSSTAAVIPSHTDSLPLTFGEAMQAGIPVIGSDVGDLPYFIEKYRVGCHFPVRDIMGLELCMEVMAENRAYYPGNFREALEELDINNSATAVAQWLESITPESQRARTVNAAAR